MSARGFSLMEIMVALALATVILFPLWRVLENVSRINASTQAPYEVQVIVENIQARLDINPDWPLPASQNLSAGYKQSLFFSAQGSEVPVDQAMYRVECEWGASPHIPYTSQRLDCIACTIYPMAENSLPLARYTLQRAHLTPRTWN